MTFTKKQVEHYLNAAEMTQVCDFDKGKLIAVKPEHMIEFARMALAGMEAEPVACIDQANLDYLKSGSGADVWPVSSSDTDSVLLYTAPQPLITSERAELENYRNAQQGVLGFLEPVAFRFWPDGDESSGFIVDSSEAPARQSGDSDADGRKWVSAPLYASPQSGAVKDGWVSCSERMPDVGDIVLTAKDGFVNVGEMERSGANYRFFTSIASGRELPATHWQPLPAAPQQEAE